MFFVSISHAAYRSGAHLTGGGKRLVAKIGRGITEPLSSDLRLVLRITPCSYVSSLVGTRLLPSPGHTDSSKALILGLPFSFTYTVT